MLGACNRRSLRTLPSTLLYNAIIIRSFAGKPNSGANIRDCADALKPQDAVCKEVIGFLALTLPLTTDCIQGM